MDEIITALIPAFNEEKRIASVLNTVIQSDLFSQVIVIDDGSSDGTKDVLKKYPVKIIELGKNQGKGAAIQAGIDSAKGSDILAFVDADLVGLTSKHLKKLIEPLINDPQLKMTVGKFKGGRKRTDWAQSLVPQISGQRAIRYDFAQDLPNLSKHGFGLEILITRYAKKKKVKMKEVVLENITQVMKEEKLGLARGFWARLKMYGQIIKSIFKVGI